MNTAITSSRNKVAERFIALCDVLLIIYAVLSGLLAYVLILAETSGTTTVDALLSLAILLALCYIIQAGRHFKIRRYITNYSSHFGAVAIIFIAPIVFISTALFPDMYPVFVLIAPAIGTIGLIRLSTLISRTPSPGSQKQLTPETLKTKKKAYLLILIPIGLFLGATLLPWVEYLTNFRMDVVPAIIFAIIRDLVSWLSIPCIIAGIIILIRLGKL